MARLFKIREDDLSGDDIRALVRLHLDGMHANSPPGHVCALVLERLKSSKITVWSAWRDGKLAGMGALKDIDGKRGELKSMRTHPDFLRQGAAATLLEHIIGVARARGMMQISLETGRGPAFGPAIALYRRYGFSFGGAFDGYEENDFSQFLYLKLG